MSTEVKVFSIPDCDLCALRNPGQTVPLPAAYDGRTRQGPWAYMCEDCWTAFGVGQLGTGFGQRLILDTGN